MSIASWRYAGAFEYLIIAKYYCCSLIRFFLNAALTALRFNSVVLISNGKAEVLIIATIIYGWTIIFLYNVFESSYLAGS